MILLFPQSLLFYGDLAHHQKTKEPKYISLKAAIVLENVLPAFKN
jgi:hypothetical protein